MRQNPRAAGLVQLSATVIGYNNYKASVLGPRATFLIYIDGRSLVSNYLMAY